jgi:hypothetical protein
MRRGIQEADRDLNRIPVFLLSLPLHLSVEENSMKVKTTVQLRTFLIGYMSNATTGNLKQGSR